MKKVRALRLSIRVLLVFTIVILVVSLYTLFSFISSISSETFNLSLTKNEATGDLMFKFNANPRNNGLLGISLLFELTILDPDYRIIATNSTYVYIEADGSQSFSITLTVPAEFVPGGELQNAKGYFQMKMNVRTLGDLVGFTQIIKIGSGGT